LKLIEIKLISSKNIYSPAVCCQVQPSFQNKLKKLTCISPINWRLDRVIQKLYAFGHSSLTQIGQLFRLWVLMIGSVGCGTIIWQPVLQAFGMKLPMLCSSPCQISNELKYCGASKSLDAPFGLFRQNYRVNYMDDAIACFDISLNDICAVDHYTVGCINADRTALNRLNHQHLARDIT